jgi:hypothetical protein
LERKTQLQGWGPSLASMTTYQDNKAIKKVKSSKARSIPHLQTINVVVFQLKFIGSMKIRLMFRVSLLEPYHASTNSKRIHDLLPPIEVDGEQEYEVDDILDSRIYNHQI